MSATRNDQLEDFAGAIIAPDSPEYPKAARTALASAEPALILRPIDVADVQRAVRFAAASDLPLVVRGGGHSAAGLSTIDDGIVIDLGVLDSIELLGDRRVRVGGGALWRHVVEALAPHGLVISSGDTADVGVGGLTLSGGIGWLVRRHGLTLDHLRAVELVTADGTVIRVDDREHEDLFWALRGGGGAYGIATAFEFEAQPAAQFTFASLTFPAGQAEHIVPAWVRFMRTAPRAISSTLVLSNPFTGGVDAPIEITFARCDAESVDDALAALRIAGTPLKEAVSRVPYAEILHEGNELPAGLRVALRNGFISPASADAAAPAIARIAASEQPASIVVHSLGGAFGQTAPEATAFAHRGAELMVSTFAAAPVAAYEGLRDRMDEIWRTLEPFTDGAYANSLDGTVADAVASVYPESTRRRLADIKRTYDPTNLFSRTFAPAPEHAR
ncbi:FAD-binding oxidoreductase [Microbacterium sp. TWP3-1-2b2]|uniref:FAD-binding oxidoreductase n=1 Tax=Microbacterium sp. TWP3-1-2b2 TaxID=2804651 RepID=UPI003CE74B39